MRIVSWNMNWADHRQSHHEAWAFLQTLEPDIALVQEAVVPDDVEPEFVVRFKQMWTTLPSGYDDEGLIHPVRFREGRFDASIPPVDSIYTDMVFDDASNTIWLAAVSGLERIDAR
jgi:hypothetical protein